MTLNELSSAVDELRAIVWGRGVEPAGPRKLANEVSALQLRMRAWNALPVYEQIGPGTVELHHIATEYERLRAAAADASFVVPPARDPIVDDYRGQAADAFGSLVSVLGDALPLLVLLGAVLLLGGGDDD